MSTGRKASRLLDVTQYQDRAALRDKALALATWADGADAYDDEYDDSFDDLAPGTRDGETDAEAARTGAQSNKCNAHALLGHRSAQNDEYVHVDFTWCQANAWQYMVWRRRAVAKA